MPKMPSRKTVAGADVLAGLASLTRPFGGRTIASMMLESPSILMSFIDGFPQVFAVAGTRGASFTQSVTERFAWLHFFER